MGTGAAAGADDQDIQTRYGVAALDRHLEDQGQPPYLRLGDGALVMLPQGDDGLVRDGVGKEIFPLDDHREGLGGDIELVGQLAEFDKILVCQQVVQQVSGAFVRISGHRSVLHLTDGVNVLAAMVLHYPQTVEGGNRSVWRMQHPAFAAAGQIEWEGGSLDWQTDESWQAAPAKDIRMHGSCPDTSRLVIQEEARGDASLQGWRLPGYDAAGWQSAAVYPKGAFLPTVSPAFQRKRNIPFLFEEKRPLHVFRAVQGDAAGWAALLEKSEPLTLPAHSEAVVELAAGRLMTAYLTLRVQGGRGSVIQWMPAEGYVQPRDGGASKGDRLDWQHGVLTGPTDRYEVGGFGAADDRLARQAIDSFARSQRADGLLQDGPGLEQYSQHVQVFGVLTGTLTGQEARAALEQMLDDPDIPQCTVAMGFYLFRALEQCGLYHRTFRLWDKWRRMLANHLTICVESDGSYTRSDCHGWGALALYELPSAILGVRPAKPGYAAAAFKPAAGAWTHAAGEVVTPRGIIRAQWDVAGSKLTKNIQLPEGMVLAEETDDF